MALTFTRLRYVPFCAVEENGWGLTWVGTWFTYAVMQIFFGGFNGLENRVGAVDINKAAGDTVI